MDILQYTFFQNALIGAFLASILCGMVYLSKPLLVWYGGNRPIRHVCWQKV